MPELPEVETVRLGLAPAMEGAELSRLQLNRAGLRYPFPKGLAGALEGTRIKNLSRRAKYLLIRFDNGKVLIVHLGMSGSLRIENTDGPDAFYHERNKDERHDHLVFHLQKGGKKTNVIYNDPRRFGFFDLTGLDDLSQNRHLAGLGIEPLGDKFGNELSVQFLAEHFCGKTRPVKSALLDQRLIAGLGNIYVCEALFYAGIHPARSIGTLTSKTGKPKLELGRLADAIVRVLQDAIKAGGSSLRDHRLTDGSLGYFQHNFAVYDRQGKNCVKPDCNGTIARMVQSGRSSFYCPKCQKAV